MRYVVIIAIYILSALIAGFLGGIVGLTIEDPGAKDLFGSIFIALPIYVGLRTVVQKYLVKSSIHGQFIWTAVREFFLVYLFFAVIAVIFAFALG